MADPVQIVLGLIGSNDVASCSKLAEGLRAVMNRRNQNIFWHAIVDKATQLQDQKKSSDPLAMAKVFAANKLDINVALENGELPMGLLMARSPQLFAKAMGSLPVNINAVDRAGHTLAMRALDLAKTKSANIYDAMAAMVNAPAFDLKAGDQGASVCFKGLAWAPLAAALGDPDSAASGARSLIAALASKDYDFNAARETADVKFGSTINTPLAYCIKKSATWLEWSGNSAKGQRVGEVVWSIAQDLIGRGADPCLQMEPGQRVQLMDLCRQSSFPQGMMQSLEAGLLSQSVPKPGERRGAARRL